MVFGQVRRETGICCTSWTVERSRHCLKVALLVSFRRKCFIPSGAAALAAVEKTFLRKALDSFEAQ